MNPCLVWTMITPCSIRTILSDSDNITSTSLGSLSYAEAIPIDNSEGITDSKFITRPSCFETTF